MSELQGKLPEVQLNALAERITKGSTPTSYGYEYKAEGIKFIKAENINAFGYATTTSSYIDDETHEFLSRSKLKENDLLFSIAGTIGRVGIVRDIDLPANTNQALAIIRLAESTLDIKYLFYYLNSPMIQKTAINNVVGVGRANLSLKNIGEFKIPIVPLDQQKRIVAKIEELFSHIDAGVDGLKKTQRLLKQYRQSVLKAAVTGELTKEWREENKDKLESVSVLLEKILEQRKAKGKYKESVEYRFEGELPPIPSTWMWVSPEQIASADDYALAIGPFGSNLKVSDYRDEGVPLVFVRNIRSHNYDKETAKYVTPEKAEELKAHSVSGADVLITKMGEPPGDASIYPKTEPDAIITADCIKWRLSSLIDCPELYVHIVNSQLIRDQIVQRTKGVAQKKISLGTFRSIAFPLPPVEEQREILRVIEEKMGAADRLLREIERQLVRAERNKQSVLVSAFSGFM